MMPQLEREEVKGAAEARTRPTYLEQFDSKDGFTPAKKGLLKKSKFKPTKSMIPAQKVQGAAYQNEGSQLQTVPAVFKSN